MNKLVMIGMTFLLLGANAQAQDFEMMQLAQNLGDVLASEEPCGLTYDQDAIAAFIADKVPADDMGFNSDLSTMTMGASYMFANMSGSQKTAHCAQTERVAKSYGFIQ
ncbi:hypothetical protein [Martelella mediterranea]|uniref:Signal recognition particle n=1 Tax=Martelella mediterranea DSM 17316 TaxID=1122214 RepID=A0A1U9Z2K5_9HYPH|nr:hypothetical protein [Martelella mediterranea]AQZ51933.1 hypothetical protein Mame_02607 [Martelella mediterranea DSM 17316]